MLLAYLHTKQCAHSFSLVGNRPVKQHCRYFRLPDNLTQRRLGLIFWYLVLQWYFFSAHNLRSLHPSASVSLLDCTIQNLSVISEPLLDGVALHGLVISSGGELGSVRADAFRGLASPLQALGLPNNRLTEVPTEALQVLPELDKLDLSGNKIRQINGSCFAVGITYHCSESSQKRI